MFQFTHPGKGATIDRRKEISDRRFQFTHPGKGATQLEEAGASTLCRFQFTHPGKGATVYYDFYRRQDYVSIHAPWEGCDSLLGGVLGYFGQFQFTHPGKGATSQSCSRLFIGASFNSRTLGRVRHKGDRTEYISRWFQFTHPGKGATGKDAREVARVVVSIHAPWEGCDTSATTRHRRKRVSIHAPWEGCDDYERPHIPRYLLFQFTHPGKGATRNVYKHSSHEWSFNSRTLGRVRLDACNTISDSWEFQFTHPGKGATRR